MSVSSKRIVVFGGSGYLGHAVTSRLSTNGIETCVAVRRPEHFRQRDRALGNGQIQPVQVDIRDEERVRQVITGCDGVVNAVGLYVETKSETFEAIHEQGAWNIARQVADQNIENLVHISGIGADTGSPSHYVRARARGEALVRDACPWATIVRPSVLFGPDDGFIRALAGIVQRSPIVPLFGRGSTRLQPVHVDDVAAAVVSALEMPEARGQIYEVGGPLAYTYREILMLVLAWMGHRRVLLPVPFPIWRVLVAISSVLPNPPLTMAQIALMQADNVVGDDMPCLTNLGVEPIELEAFLRANPWPGRSTG